MDWCRCWCWCVGVVLRTEPFGVGVPPTDGAAFSLAMTYNITVNLFASKWSCGGSDGFGTERAFPGQDGRSWITLDVARL